MASIRNEVGFLFLVCIILQGRQCMNANSTKDHLDKRALSKCFEDLGCFAITKDFIHPLRRPFNPLPADRESINTKFLLYTKYNVQQPHLLKAKNEHSISTSEFNSTRETKIIVHGYMDNQLFAEWMRSMKDQFLMHGDYNIIIVDWSGGNGLPYAQASSNTRIVGAEVALLVNYLKENFGLKTEKVHILGHSLGSHIAGYAGERIKTLARITCMDPAEPFFEGMPPSVRIDPTDADFVDAIHTDSKSIFLLGFGMSDLVGHVDFFPNDGNNHPGCNISGSLWSIVTTGLAEGARRFTACNHQRSVDFMTDSINNRQCLMVGNACNDWQTYLSGKCTSCGTKGEKCAIMGLRAIESKEVLQRTGNPGKMYFQTAAKSPFCMFHYQVTLKMDKSQGTKRSGQIAVTLKGDKQEETFNLGSDSTDYHPGESQTFLVNTQKDLGNINGLTLGWNAKSFLPSIFRKHRLYLDFARVYSMGYVLDGDRKSKISTFCDKTMNPIEHKHKINLSIKESCD